MAKCLNLIYEFEVSVKLTSNYRYYVNGTVCVALLKDGYNINFGLIAPEQNLKNN